MGFRSTAMKTPVPKQEFKGQMFGVKLVQRDANDTHVCLQLLSEDDEHWSKVGTRFSSYWIDDLIEQLYTAKKALESLPKAKDGFGYDFKDQI